MCVLIFCTIFIWNVIHTEKNSARYHECTYVFMPIALYSCQILTKLEIFCTEFRKTVIHKSMKIRIVGAELFHADGRTDRHGEANSRLLQFCERIWNGISKNNFFSQTKLWIRKLTYICPLLPRLQQRARDLRVSKLYCRRFKSCELLRREDWCVFADNLKDCGTVADCGVCSWPWQWFALGNGDRPL